MKTYIIALVLFISAFSDTLNAEKLQIWTDKDFDSKLKEHGSAFIKFFAPWCGHCKRLAPTWEKLAGELDPNYAAVVKVDCTADGSETCSRFDVKGYPTLMFVKHDDDKDEVTNSAIPYNGDREISSLKKFAQIHGAPLFTEIEDEDVADFLDDDADTVFMLFTANNKTEAFTSFIDAAKRFVGLAQFGVSFTKDPKKLVNFAQPESSVFQRSKNLRTKSEPSTGASSDHKNFEKFIADNIFGKVAIRGHDIESKLERPLATVFIASSPAKNESYFKMIRNRLFPVADKFPQLHFAIAPMEPYEGLIRHIKFDSEKDNIIYTVEEDMMKLYVPTSSISFDDVKDLPEKFTKFLTDYTEGKIEPFVASEPIPDSQEEGKPYKVVAKSFESVVFNDKTDVFIKMYAPWCGHCKQLAPVWDQLAEKFKDDPSIVIAKFDATANDIVHSEYEITGYPTLFFAKSGKKMEPLTYSGAKTLDALVDYVKEHATKAAPVKDEL